MIGVSQISVVAYRGGGGAAPVNPDFISIWDTTKAGSASDTVVLPLLSGGVYSGTIDWGDGNSDALSYANRTHVYASSGIYTITISGTDIQGFQFNNGGDRRKITDVSNWGNLTLTTNAVFYGCNNLQVSAIDAPTITTTSFLRMFQQCTVFNTDISHWDVSSVTDMQSCFESATAYNQPLNGWDTSNVLKTESMFRIATSFNSAIDQLDVSNVTNANAMFFGATAFNQPVENLTFTSLTSTSQMFYNASSFNQPLNGWDMSNITNVFAMFYGATAFNQPLNSWDVGNVQNFSQLFQGAPFNGSFNQDISMWDMTSATNVSRMFQNTPFNQPIGSWVFGSTITSAQSMLENADSFNQDLSGWDVTKMTNMTSFMLSATGLSTVNYDALLVGWESTLQATWSGGAGYPYTININFGGSKYTSAGAGGTARASLISNFGWTITDGGGV